MRKFIGFLLCVTVLVFSVSADAERYHDYGDTQIACIAETDAVVYAVDFTEEFQPVWFIVSGEAEIPRMSIGNLQPCEQWIFSPFRLCKTNICLNDNNGTYSLRNDILQTFQFGKRRYGQILFSM